MKPALDGRHVVITGGTGGLGGAVVEAVAAAGAICHLPTQGPAPQTIRDLPGTEFVPGIDLTDEKAVVAFYASLPSLWASIHLAGGFKAGRIISTSLADLTRQVELNLVTAFLCCREAARLMRKADGGRIVNVGSRAADVPASGTAAYAASKGAVATLTRSLAEEVKRDRILVNAVVPSIIDTPANRAAMPKADPSGWPKPAEIADVIVWLASPQNRLTSGALVPVYGAV
jgi:NAD(P)-dependent dehydrogenase (short-subunit alcohol dehydrogenase family)